MAGHLHKIHGADRLMPAQAMRAPLGNLSCPYSRRDAARRDPWTTDYWNPPTTRRQHVRQRIVAVVVALVLAALLAHAGW
jgi:hypothetical protein